jgi:hypothetical protein
MQSRRYRSWQPMTVDANAFLGRFGLLWLGLAYRKMSFASTIRLCHTWESLLMGQNSSCSGHFAADEIQTIFCGFHRNYSEINEVHHSWARHCRRVNYDALEYWGCLRQYSTHFGPHSCCSRNRAGSCYLCLVVGAETQALLVEVVSGLL